MERVKIFYSWHSEKCKIGLENDIGCWLAAMGDEIEVTQRLQSLSGGNILITIFYKTKK